MSSRRDAIRMDADERTAFLETMPFGVLATIGPQGDPHQVTLGFALDGPDAVILSSFAAAQKVRNVERLPRGSFLVERTEPYDQICGVLLSGPMRVVRDHDQVADWFVRMKERTARIRDPRHLPPMDEDAVIAKRALLVLEVERAVTWDHSKLAKGVY